MIVEISLGKLFREKINLTAIHDVLPWLIIICDKLDCNELLGTNGLYTDTKGRDYLIMF